MLTGTMKWQAHGPGKELLGQGPKQAFRPATRPVAAECTFLVCYLVKLCRPRFHDSRIEWHDSAHVMSTIGARSGHLNKSWSGCALAYLLQDVRHDPAMRVPMAALSDRPVGDVRDILQEPARDF